MHFLSVFSLRNRALIALVTIVVAIFGSIALTSLKQELIPSVTFPRLVVITNYPGAAPEVVDTDVSGKIEQAIQAVPGIKDTTATSSTNLSSVSASFNFGTDLATAEQKVTLAINRIKSTLPSGVDPQVITGSIDDLPVVQIAVTSNRSADDLSLLLQNRTINDLLQLDGVRAADLLGTTKQRVSITPDVAKLRAAGISNKNIRDALDANGSLLPTGSITEGGNTLTIQSGARLTSADAIGTLPLVGAKSATPGTVVTIAEVATVVVASDPITGISRVNGKPSLTVAVTKTPDGNTVSVSKEVNALIPSLEKDLGQNTKFTVVFDQAPFIQQSIDSLATEGALGLLFAVIVILIFLLSIRSTLVTAISIPVSVLITFIGMLASGYTLNIITLGALTIAIGRVVDDSIVVIENIKRHLSFGEDRLSAISSGVKEVASAITASTVTTVAVFLPLTLVGDITGELFRPFALTVTIALAASLFVALTIVPVLAYWFLRSPKARKHSGAVDAAIPSGVIPSAAVAGVNERDANTPPTRLQRSYLPVLRFTLARPLATIGVALLILVGTGALIPSLKTNFIGDSGQNTLTVTQKLPLGASLATLDTAATTVEKTLIGLRGVKVVQTSIGQSGSSLRQAFLSNGSVSFSITTDPAVDQSALQERVRAAVKKLSGVGDVSLASAGSAFASSDISINITANREADLTRAARSVLAAVKNLSVTAQAGSDLSAAQPFIAVTVDRTKAAQSGLSEVAVGGIVAQSLLPSAVGSVVINEKTLSIYINNADAPLTVQALRDFAIPTATGPLKLSDLATVEQTNGPASITTIKGLRAATVTVTPRSNDVGTASAAVTTALAGATLPAGATATIGGVTAQQGDAFQQLGLALLVAILIVYVVMVATFKSLRQPLILLISVPFAATGAILLQVLSGIPLGVPSLIGVLMLIGIVVTNAIVLVDLINQYRSRGLKVGDAILQGASRRLRPILMTAAATIFALLPLAIGLTGTGGFISQPLAIIVIGGLVSSTILTLVVLPVLYYLVEGAKERRVDRQFSRSTTGSQAIVQNPRIGGVDPVM
ncbi:MAG: efflux RND transporter permease subunit [Microbacteriaceae bacterium]|nr:efflux RND transporter permease subunit [Microbacteriaceae bacterium]